ncbi:MAG: hypothetical protein AAF844_04250 [Pseudomonadota bacterium]
MSVIDTVESALVGPSAKALTLLATRVFMGGLIFWWGLVKGLDLGVGQAVSDRFYGGLFSFDALLIGFGWLQAAAGILVALGLFRRLVLPFQLVINTFVALSVWWTILDPFWLWMPGEKPVEVGHLFYPSAIVAAVSWLLIAFRAEDRLALDRLIGLNRDSV